MNAFRSRLWAIGLLVLLVGSLAAGAHAQSDIPSEQEAPPDDAMVGPDPFFRHTPRSMVQACLEVLDEERYEDADVYFDLRYMWQSGRMLSSEEIAERLRFVLDRRLWIDIGGLSDDPEGTLTDGLPAQRELLGTIAHRGEDVPIYLQRAPDGNGQQVWKFSSVSLRRVLDLYDDLEYPPFVTWVQNHTPDVRILGIELFKWAIGLSITILSYPVLYVVGLVIARLVTRRSSAYAPRVRVFLTRPVAIITALLLGRAAMMDLGLSTTAQRIFEAKTVLILLALWALFSALALTRDLWSDVVRRRKGDAATIVLRPVFTSLRVLLVLGAVVLWLDNIGFNVTTLVAGLGIGGLAVALALQKSLEDLFGAVTLFTQQPVRINDFCQFGTQRGTVLEIGLRSTRVRTLDNTVLTIPNARFAGEYIENITLRDSIRYKQDFHLRYDVKADQLERILARITEMLESDDRLREKGRRVRAKALDQIGVAIGIVARVETTVYEEFTRVSEELNIGVVRIVHDEGAEFAQRIDPV